MSDLYFSLENIENEFSGWSFEFSFRIVPYAGDEACNGAEHEPIWVINVINNLARYIFKGGKWFNLYHFIPVNSLSGIEYCRLGFCAQPATADNCDAQR